MNVKLHKIWRIFTVNITTPESSPQADTALESPFDLWQHLRRSTQSRMHVWNPDAHLPTYIAGNISLADKHSHAFISFRTILSTKLARCLTFALLSCVLRSVFRPNH